MNKKPFSLFILVTLLVSLLPATVAAAPPRQEGGKTYTVQKDDWLSKIADKEYGDPYAWPAIFYYNNLKALEDDTYNHIEDADLIEIGWTLYIPTAEEAAAYMAGEVAAPVPTEFKEAPMLAELVAKGELPPVEERLSKDPLVVLPIESIGQYGGTWYRGWRGIKDFHCYGRINYEPMLRWPRDPREGVQPGLAKDWKWSDGGQTLTLYLREGLKWSDGAPFTVDDIIFWWEDIENDTDITTAPHTEWVVAGEPMELEKVDDTTIKLKFAGPNGLAETVGLAFHGNQWPLGFERFGFFAPRHYLEQFHPKYNADATYDLFEEMAWEYNPERPAMTPWRVTEWEAGADHMVASRNPYYWKVDPEGNQLPYIDEVYFYLVEDCSAVESLALAGKIDMQARCMSLSTYPVFLENAAAGDYEAFLWTTASASGLTFFPNQSYSDPAYRELLQDLKFRQALSLAIDRDTLNDIVWLGQATPRTISVVRDSALRTSRITMLSTIPTEPRRFSTRSGCRWAQTACGPSLTARS
jgi:peptide/nickel transport system substrate-binding protein